MKASECLCQTGGGEGGHRAGSAPAATPFHCTPIWRVSRDGESGVVRAPQ